jgi:tRNA threonylcarbamoyladenosine biosynthesis protein TsaE
LGGGKTTFVRGLAAGLGSSDIVSSPTFTISKTYKTNNAEIHHFDFYRLNDAGIIKDQLKESLQSPDSIIVIEWSDIIKDVLPDKRYIIDISLTANDADEREISFHYPEDYSSTIKSLETDWARI